MRQDVLLTGACTVVFLFEKEKFYVRLLRRGKPPTYLTPKCEVDPGELQRILKVSEMLRKSKNDTPIGFDIGEVRLVITKDKALASLVGATVAEGFGPVSNLFTAIFKVLESAGISVTG